MLLIFSIPNGNGGWLELIHRPQVADISAIMTLSQHGVANRLEQRSLLIAVNAVAALSIFFFGYDQGVMGGVNTARHYASLM
ncbi:hypothetical protein LTR56_024453 [Elasticomyces elasticus]|nr:hypothetical protein LTR56_024453 [Elasticomyces elasticus]KAK4905595.1 hypothetical protein LTR49_025133 [Elasticomyces elasticus]